MIHGALGRALSQVHSLVSLPFSYCNEERFPTSIPALWIKQHHLEQSYPVQAIKTQNQTPVQGCKLQSHMNLSSGFNGKAAISKSAAFEKAIFWLNSAFSSLLQMSSVYMTSKSQHLPEVIKGHFGRISARHGWVKIHGKQQRQFVFKNTPRIPQLTKAMHTATKTICEQISFTDLNNSNWPSI